MVIGDNHITFSKKLQIDKYLKNNMDKTNISTVVEFLKETVSKYQFPF